MGTKSLQALDDVQIRERTNVVIDIRIAARRRQGAEAEDTRRVGRHQSSPDLPAPRRELDAVDLERRLPAVNIQKPTIRSELVDSVGNFDPGNRGRLASRNRVEIILSVGP